MRNSRQSFQSVSSIFPALHSRNVLLLPAIITSHIQTAVYFLPVSLLRSFIYIGLMTWWGISLWQRIVQTQVRRYLAATAALCVFWLSIRTVKFFFAATPAAMLEEQIPQKEQRLAQLQAREANVDAFIEKAKQYTAIDTLTPELLRLFIQRIEVGERETKYSRNSSQSVRIIYRDIGTLDSAMQPDEKQPKLLPPLSEVIQFPA